MFRPALAFRATTAGLLALGAAVALTGCFGSGPAPEATPKPTATGFATIGETPVPFETGAPIDPTDPPESGFTQVFDDLGVVTVAVPDAWGDIDGEGFTTDQGQEWAYVAASDDLDAYWSSWTASGVEVAATSTDGVSDADLEALLASVSAGYAECGSTIEDDVPYFDGVFSGFTSTWTKCGPGDVTAFAIAVATSDRTKAMFVRGQINAEKYDVDEVLGAIVNSFDTSIGRGRSR